jgi:two-component sensor histidine kinase
VSAERSPAHPASEAIGAEHRRIAILAPYGQDALLISDVLSSSGAPECYRDVESFCESIGSAGVGVLTTEALTPAGVASLRQALHAQPPWSDVPIVLLTNRIDPASYSILAEGLGNVVIIQRPLDPHSLITVVKTALRARQKQYEVRDLLESGAAQRERIDSLNARLKRAMTETHHRVKNSLQLISAFVDIQANDYDDMVPVAQLQRINTQVRTLAAVHDVLTHEAKERDGDGLVSARSLLEKLFPMIACMAGTNELTYNLDEVRLPPRRGTSLALIANELILNALKHGNSNVDVTLKADGESVELRVADDGPGLPEGFAAGNEATTGLGLVENLTRWDLQGETEYGNRRDGRGALIKVAFPRAFDGEA